MGNYHSGENMGDLTVGRRDVLRTLAATGAATGLAGCSDDGDTGGSNGGSGSGGGSGGGSGTGGNGSGSGSGGGSDGGEAGPDQAVAGDGVIRDTFEDGDYATDLEWEISLCDDCAADVSVVDRASPDGGSKALRLEDADDADATFMDGPEAELTEAARFSPGPWTVEGQFYTETLSTPEEEDPMRVYIDISGVTFIPQGIETRERNRVHLNHEDASNGVTEHVSAPELEEDTWYEYTISHDGEGTYTAARHTLDADGNRAASTEITMTSEAPLQNANVSFRVLGGTGGASDMGESPVAIEHSYVEWRDDSA